jgi:putative aldouronate transport system permease protein
MRASPSERVFYGLNYTFLIGTAAVMVFPFLHVAAISLSSSRAVVSQEVVVWPVEFSTRAYQNLIRDGSLFNALKNTVIVTIIGTALNMVATIMIAYPMARQNLRGRKVFLSMIIFTMLFNGGLIPTYVVVQQLGLLNTYWSVWLTGLVSIWNFFIMKTFFQSLPSSLIEAAAIDGANDLYSLVRIVLPLSMPVLATLTLFYAVNHWNSYFIVMLYITKTEMQTVMVRLMQMIQSIDPQLMELSGEAADLQRMITPEGVRAGAIVISTLPIMAVYPFLQKYFVKGVMIGSLKQ